MNSPANRGKWAEGEVKTLLAKLASSSSRVDWQRNYDAHSAGGKFPSQTGDFSFFSPNCHGVIEVKEVHHPTRLPYKNFENTGKLRVRELAGGKIVILVAHLPEKLWRIVPFEFIKIKDPAKPSGSWVLTDFPPCSLANVESWLASQMGLPPHLT